MDVEEAVLDPAWQINPHDIFFCSRSNGKLCKLGKGAFGTVRGLISSIPSVRGAQHSRPLGVNSGECMMNAVANDKMGPHIE